MKLYYTPEVAQMLPSFVEWVRENTGVEFTGTVEKPSDQHTEEMLTVFDVPADGLWLVHHKTNIYGTKWVRGVTFPDGRMAITAFDYNDFNTHTDLKLIGTVFVHEMGHRLGARLNPGHGADGKPTPATKYHCQRVGCVMSCVGSRVEQEARQIAFCHECCAEIFEAGRI